MAAPAERVPYSARHGPLAHYLPNIIHQGGAGICAFASTIQYVKFLVSSRFQLDPAELDGLTYQPLLDAMLQEGNAYGLILDAETGDCPTTPLTVLRYIRDHGLLIPGHGTLRIPLTILTVQIIPNMNNIDRGIGRGGEDCTYVSSPDEAWETITTVIDEVGVILGEMNAVAKHFENHNSQGVYVQRVERGRKRLGKIMGHACMITGHNYAAGGKRYFEVHNTYGLGWGGGNDGYGKLRLNMRQGLRDSEGSSWIQGGCS